MEEDAELAETFRLLLESPESDERAKQGAIASFHYFARLGKKRPGMMTVPELRKEIAKQKGGTMNKYDGLFLFFEEEIAEHFGETKEDWIQTGVQTGIYNTIYRNLQTKYGAQSLPKELSEKIDAINYYPALEEVQTAVWTTPSLTAFERKIDEIAKQYETEIQETRK